MSEIATIDRGRTRTVRQVKPKDPTLETSLSVAAQARECLDEAMAALYEHAKVAQQTYNGRELTLFEERPDRVGVLVGLLMEGNYRGTAAQIVGISERVIRYWLEAAERDDARFGVVSDVILRAEAFGESDAVRSVRKAGKDPRFWAADMTFLERKHPERWGRRQEENNGPRVLVQIGVSAGDVRINLGTTTESTPSPKMI